MKVQEALKAAIKAMELANISCEHFHHKKKHQHLYGEKCIPEDMWKDALELCKAALSDLDKCEPVAYISNDAKLPLTDDGSYWLYPEKLEYRIALYDKPQPRDWVVPSNAVIDFIWHKATHESVAHSEPFTRYRFTELLIKQLNTKG